MATIYNYFQNLGSGVQNLGQNKRTVKVTNHTNISIDQKLINELAAYNSDLIDEKLRDNPSYCYDQNIKLSGLTILNIHERLNTLEYLRAVDSYNGIWIGDIHCDYIGHKLKITVANEIADDDNTYFFNTTINIY